MEAVRWENMRFRTLMPVIAHVCSSLEPPDVTRRDATRRDRWRRCRVSLGKNPTCRFGLVSRGHAWLFIIQNVRVNWIGRFARRCVDFACFWFLKIMPVSCCWMQVETLCFRWVSPSDNRWHLLSTWSVPPKSLIVREGKHFCLIYGRLQPKVLDL